jgi:isochorismate synthase
LNAERFCRLLRDNNVPFALYRLPNEKHFQLIAQTSDATLQLNQEEDFVARNGFVFFPFLVTEKYPAIFIQPDLKISFSDFKDNILIDKTVIRKGDSVNQNNYDSENIQSTTKTDFIDWVEKTILKIKSGDLEKGVMSGITARDASDNFDEMNLFEKLSSSYPNVFVYIINTSLSGCWIGATPELLMKFNEHQVETVSLAGTQFDSGNNGSPSWGQKEIEEQQLVTKHIQQSFEKNFAEPLHISETKTISTGHLLHLRTDFKLQSQNGILKNFIYKFLKNLHPTPAISGSPKDASLEHILQTENHERAYYTGFLGPVGLHDSSYLFVNLRCLRCENGKLIIYAGAGITADSVPENEWDEIQLKAQTILKIL